MLFLKSSDDTSQNAPPQEQPVQETKMNYIKEVEIPIRIEASENKQPSHPQRQSVGTDEVRLSKDKLLNKYRSHIPGDMFDAMIMCDDDMITIKQSDLDKLDEKLKEEKAFNKKLQKTAELNNAGMKLEKDGKIDEAIQIYEKNVKLGYPASHSYDRLMILYRKQKDTKNEVRIIEMAIEKFPKDVKYKERLSKVNKKS